MGAQTTKVALRAGGHGSREPRAKANRMTRLAEVCTNKEKKKSIQTTSFELFGPAVSVRPTVSAHNKLPSIWRN